MRLIARTKSCFSVEPAVFGSLYSWLGSSIKHTRGWLLLPLLPQFQSPLKEMWSLSVSSASLSPVFPQRAFGSTFPLYFEMHWLDLNGVCAPVFTQTEINYAHGDRRIKSSISGHAAFPRFLSDRKRVCGFVSADECVLVICLGNAQELHIGNNY